MLLWEDELLYKWTTHYSLTFNMYITGSLNTVFVKRLRIYQKNTQKRKLCTYSKSNILYKNIACCHFQKIQQLWSRLSHLRHKCEKRPYYIRIKILSINTVLQTFERHKLSLFFQYLCLCHTTNYNKLSSNLQFYLFVSPPQPPTMVDPLPNVIRRKTPQKEK